MADENEQQGPEAGASDDAAQPKPTRAERRAAAQEAAEPTFTRERLVGPDGPTITGHPHPVLVGALHDEQEDAEFTRAQIERKVATFHERPVATEG